MKLIDKDALVAEIESIEHETNYEPFTDEVLGKRCVCRSLLSFLDTLETKEVDLECTKSVFEGQYLNKDKVVTTIERLQDECEEKGDNNGVDLLENLFNKLDTLETKEVDLDKEIEEVKHNYKVDDNQHTSICSADIEWLAKHFYELGLKAQK